MERKKLEQTILIVLIPVFVVSFVYMRLQKGRVPAAGQSGAAGTRSRYAQDETIDMIPRPAGGLSIKYEGSAKDPLRNMLEAHLYKLRIEQAKRPKDVDRKVVPLPRLNIGGLLWGTDMPQAIINGKVIKIGDTIEGVKIAGIEKTGITVIHEGERVFIPKK